MILWNIVFALALLGAAYVVNKVIVWPAAYETLWGKPIPYLMVNFFLLIVFLLWVLGLFGIGR